MWFTTWISVLTFVVAALSQGAPLDGNDECLSGSVAKTLAATFVFDSTAPNNVLLQNMYNHFIVQPSRHIFKFYLGKANGDFIGIWNCWAWGNVKAENCPTSLQYVAVLRDDALFGDNMTHSFALNHNGTVQGNELHASTTMFDTLNQPWFVRGDGWEEFTSFSTTGYEYTYSISFPGGVLAGVREPLEPCTACLTHSYARAAPSLLVTYNDLTVARGVVTAEGVSNVTIMLMTFAKTIPGFPEQFRNLYMGLNDGSYYGIYNCKWPDYVEVCAGTGPDGKDLDWFANIKNIHVPGYSTDGRRDRRALDDTGAIVGVMDGSAAPFDTVNRPWFKQQAGWTQPFVGAAVGSMNRGYVANYQDGVVVSDTSVPCADMICSNNNEESSEPVLIGLMVLAGASGGFALVLLLREAWYTVTASRRVEFD